MATKTQTTDATVSKIVSVQALAELNEFAFGARKAFLMQESAATHLVRAAIKARGAFPATVESWYESIRNDVKGIATRLGAERNKAGDKFVVPQNLRTQVSQVLRALEAGIDLGTAEKPKGMGVIRKETAEAEEAKAAAAPKPELTGEEAIKATIVTALNDAIAETLKATGATLEAIKTATEAYCAAVLEALAKAPKEPEAEKPAAMPEAQPEPAAAATRPTVTVRKRKSA